MFKKYNNRSNHTQLEPLALTVVLTSLGVAFLLFGTATMGMSPALVSGYQVSIDAQSR